MKKIIPFLFLSSLTFLQAFGQNNLTPEQERLSIFKGSWTIPGSDSTYLEVCEFIQGNHIRCKSLDKENGKVDSSMSFLSYLAPEKTYVYYGLYSSGTSRTLRGYWSEDRFIFTGQRVTDEKTTKWKVTIIPANANIRFKEEVSVNDGPWETRVDFEYKRLQ